MRFLAGRHAVISGASSGLGAGIAEALAKEGADVTLSVRSKDDELAELCTRISAHGVRAHVVDGDITLAAGRKRLLSSAEKALGPIDVLINNAGVERAGAFHEEDPKTIERTISVNLTATMLLTRAVLPGMLDRQRGHIVNVASVAGKMAAPFEAVYTASKFGIVGFTQALRGELDGTAVSCSAVCPGFIRDEGMYGRWESEGLTAPALLGASSLRDVSAAVIEAITDDRAEVIVNPTPLLPVLLFQAAAPGLHGRAAKVMGVTDIFRRAADLQKRAGATTGSGPKDLAEAGDGPDGHTSPVPSAPCGSPDS